MRKHEKKRLGLQEWDIETVSGDEAFSALRDGMVELRQRASQIEIEAQHRKEIAAKRMIYWQNRVNHTANLSDVDLRIADFLAWAVDKEEPKFPPPSLFEEGTYDRLLAEWLLRHREHQAFLETGDIVGAIEHAFILGRLAEVFWWRFGQDQDTGKRREDLALAKKRQQAALPKARSKRSQRAIVYPDWWEEAKEQARAIWKENPSLSKSRVAQRVHGRLGSPQSPTPDTIRKII